MKLKERQRAIKLRKKGFSYTEIIQQVPVSKSTLSLWLEEVKLSNASRKRLDSLFTNGQLKSMESIRKKTRAKELIAKNNAEEVVKKINFPSLYKFIAAILFWCEGVKNVRSSTSFTNSDPEMIKIFLKFLRRGFVLDETKFRVCVHLHSYHKKDTVLQYWSKITDIPLSQFIKPYLKQTNGMYKKDGYQGCIRVVYQDVSVVRELFAIRDVFINRIGK